MLLYAYGNYHAFDGQTWSFKKRYIAVSDGSIINKMGHLMSKKDIQNTMSLKDDDDILRSIRVNRFILSSFIEQKPPAGHHADHIDEENPEDNSLNNLQWLTPGDNNRKKRKNTRDRRSSLPVIFVSKTDMPIEFPSILFASEKTGISQRSITRSCIKTMTEGIQTDVYWKYDTSKLEQTDLEGEIWVDPLMKDGSVYPKDTNIKVSSAGRIMWVTPVIRIFDSMTLNTERDIDRETRASIKIFHDRRMLHELICSSFHGPAPFEEAVVRHLNDIYTDCHKDNLAWGTRLQNAQDAISNNRLKTIKIIIDDKEFETMSSAANYLNISVGYLSEVCKKEKTTTFSSDFFTIKVYKIDDIFFYKREDLANDYKISISQARTLEHKGKITTSYIKTIDSKCK
ncbi:hypothetical protein PBCVCZ2_164L [Paramecium bursaria Chlorella virus CZ-2]|nr:hypothetical protein PBCVCZ2_164L [Paramecium bursaria Chlorella virus CZ-2]